MRVTKLTLNGQNIDTAAVNEPGYQTLELQQSIVLSPVVRGADNLVQVNLTDDHLVELVFEDQTTWLCTPDTLEELYPGQFEQQRSGEEIFRLPQTVTANQPQRGIIQQVALKIVNLFTKKKLTEAAAAIGMTELAKVLEEKQLGTMRGLVRVTPTFDLVPFTAADLEGKKEPVLLFIHGTNSSTMGSYAELLGTGLWAYITEKYNSNNILAFNHETLTKSPLQNAVELVEQLPADCDIHIITHSRGGLVGEILARCSDTTQSFTGFSAKEIKYLNDEGRTSDVGFISRLQEAYRAKRFKVSRFVRVACPAAGTTILSQRLDHFFNISLNLIGIAAGALANPVYSAMKNLLVAAIDQKNNVDSLPGLEAMNPTSPFITVINNQDTTIERPVVAISGNCKAKLNFKAVLILAEKLFFMEDNDLVVNTKSMYAGSKRSIKLQYFFDEGTDVDHFHYFKNSRTNTAILLALQSPQFTEAAALSGFAEYSRGGIQGADYSTGSPSGKKPIVILLPGIMGSCLSKDFDDIWLNYWRMLKGALLQLDTSATGISATAIVKTSYQQLGMTLSKDYDVVTFPFDWRLSSKDAAGLLDAQIKMLLALKQPIRIVAHSLGGVVVRDLMVYYKDTWAQLNSSKNFRLLFLGSPLMGSHRIVNVLFGEDDIINKLSKLDLLHSKRRLLQMFSKFPGILGLLPLTSDSQNNFAEPDVWNKMAAAFGDDTWPVPQTENELSAFKDYRDKVAAAMPNLDFSNAVYIAGQYPQTPCGYRIDDISSNKQNLVLLSTAEGDQSVTWNLGIPAKMIENNSVYYVNHSHGDLSNSPDMFSGIKEILEKGKTNLFSTIRPTVRGDQKVFRKPLMTDFDLSPDAVEKTMLGLSGSVSVATSRLPLKVGVAHGDVKYASYPVLAGHFMYDSVLNAEKRLDLLLGGQLEERNKLGIYPGPIGTCDIVLTYADTGFAGAIIAGIGEQDKLTAFDLVKTAEQAASKYLLIVNGRKKLNTNQFNSTIGISSLMIGSGYGGLSIESSVYSVLQGIINANTKISGLYGEAARLIEEVEFIELYQSKALACFYAIRSGMGNTLNILPAEDFIRERNGGRQRVSIDQGADWWNRIAISCQQDENGIIEGMKFSISTGAAREELRDVFTSGDTVERLIESISTDQSWTQEKASAIFELLMPNDFKSRLKKNSNITWVLDKYTAGFPWELLQHKGEGAKPLCINAGMIRQMSTGDARLNIDIVAANTALVVGDPQLNGFLPQLAGAVEEVGIVKQLLYSNGYTPVYLLQEQQDAIILKLMSGSYKIIHLAGHGIYDPNPKKSGMVIGKNSFLTTSQLAQMSDIPELVFVNCCYLGKTIASDEKYYQSRYKFAASFGTQLIENGVKAVVVAGWAVDDSAAKLFATQFYQNMFAGKPFGEAVRHAREVIYNSNNNINTWGAYQCYGNPYYRLETGTSVTKEKQYVISEQVEIDLLNLESDMRTGDYAAADILARVQAISAETDRSKLRVPAITELEAKIYKSLNKYDLALQKYEELMACDEGGYSFNAVELYCNLRSKLLNERIGKNEPVDVLEKEFDKVKADLEALILLSPTADRYNIMGSYWKRRTSLYTNTPGMEMAVKEAAKYYKLANQVKARAYTFTNWIALENLLVASGCQQWSTGTTVDTAETDAKASENSTDMPTRQNIDDMLATLKQVYTQKPASLIFEDWIALSNLELVKWMVTTTAGETSAYGPTTQSVIDSYLSVWVKVGSIEDWRSDIQHLQLLIDALTVLKPGHFMIGEMRLVMTGLENYLKS